ncbi:riboflavin synthase [Persephonella sp.]
MFTGIVEEVGRVIRLNPSSGGMKISVSAEKILEDIKNGDSIAVNGVCLTVVSFSEKEVLFDVSQETINRSNIGHLQVGDPVNLERALRPSDRLGGHIVQGHVDTTGRIKNIIPRGEHTEFVIQLPVSYSELVVEKGSIAVDGISLTVNRETAGIVSINVIPHTINNTNLYYRKVGDTVNIEFDIIGKYVLKALGSIKETRLNKLLENF